MVLFWARSFRPSTQPSIYLQDHLFWELCALFAGDHDKIDNMARYCVSSCACFKVVGQ